MDIRLNPGQAWDLAKLALENGDIQEAERLLKFMVPSDVKLMLRRIQEAKAKAQT